LWDQSISKDNKKRIYNTTIKSIVTYKSEILPPKNRLENMLLTTEMDFWRRSAGRERIRNETIRENMKVNTTIVEDIKINQLRWYGHVVRMERERLPKQVLLWTPQDRRRKGKPRRSWTESVRKEMRQRGLKEEQCNDRRQWKMDIGRRCRTL
jgi:hypothetical protein